MSVICITQARMNSTRLPGKILKLINGISLIEYHVQRVSRSKAIDCHIIATTDTEHDQPLVDYCDQNALQYYRGSESNVLERFYRAAKHCGAEDNDLIIRLTADCPLISPELIDAVVSAHRKKPSKDYSRLNLDYFPRGFDVEVFAMSSLKQAFEMATSQYEREHVTPFMYQPEFNKHVQNITTGDKKWADIRLCVDEQKDFDLVEKVIRHFANHWREVKYTEICQWMIANPELMAINSDVQQK